MTWGRDSQWFCFFTDRDVLRRQDPHLTISALSLPPWPQAACPWANEHHHYALKVCTMPYPWNQLEFCLQTISCHHGAWRPTPCNWVDAPPHWSCHHPEGLALYHGVQSFARSIIESNAFSSLVCLVWGSVWWNSKSSWTTLTENRGLPVSFWHLTCGRVQLEISMRSDNMSSTSWSSNKGNCVILWKFVCLLTAEYTWSTSCNDSDVPSATIVACMLPSVAQRGMRNLQLYLSFSSPLPLKSSSGLFVTVGEINSLGKMWLPVIWAWSRVTTSPCHCQLRWTASLSWVIFSIFLIILALNIIASQLRFQSSQLLDWFAHGKTALVWVEHCCRKEAVGITVMLRTQAPHDLLQVISGVSHCPSIV